MFAAIFQQEQNRLISALDSLNQQMGQILVAIEKQIQGMLDWEFKAAADRDY